MSNPQEHSPPALQATDNGHWMTPKVRLWLGLAVLVAVVLRLAHLGALLGADPLLITPMVDAEAYHDWAVEILSDPVGQKVFYQSPGYPYMVALFYAIFGPHWTVMGVVQGLLGGLEVMLIAWIAARLAPRRQAAAAAIAGAWIMALYQPLIFYSALLLKVESTNLILLLTVASYLKGLRPRGELDWRWLAASGFSLGVLVMFRGNFILAMPVLTAWIGVAWWWRRRRQPAAQAGPSLKVMLGGASAFAVGFACVLLLVMARNKVVADQWVATNATSGSVLFIGNNPYSPLGDYMHMPFVRTHPKFEEVDFRAEAERRTGRQMTTQEASRYWRDEAIKYSLDNPGQTVRRAFHKLALIAESYELGDNYSLTFHGLHSPVVGTTIPWWALVMALSVAWLVAVDKGRVQAAPVWLLLGVYVASLVIFFVRSRYRIPMAPLMIILAALELGVLVELIQQGRADTKPEPDKDQIEEPNTTAIDANAHAKRLGLHLGMIAVMLGTSLYFGVPRAQGENLATWWMSLGMAHSERGDVEGGEALMLKALELQPEEGIIWMNLGKLALAQDQADKAARLCARSIELDKTRNDARECLALALAQKGDLNAAWAALQPAISPTMQMVRLELAVRLLLAGQKRAEAHALLDKTAPKHGQLAGFHVLRFMTDAGVAPEKARAHLQKALKLAQDPQERAYIEHLLAGGQP